MCRNKNYVTSVLIAMVLAAGSFGCGGCSSAPSNPPPPPPNPTPAIATISPANATAGGPALTLTVNGSNFVSSSVVQWNGSNRPTSFMSGSQVTTQISASDIAVSGTAAVAVFNPAPGGGSSNSLAFTINNPAPTHDIAVRMVNGQGQLFSRSTGAKFTPRGHNYVRLATQQTPSGGTTFYHSTFNVGLYDSSSVERAFVQMQSNGYNVVRVWLNGCCVGGLGDPAAGGLSSAYLANLTDFLTRAKAHGIFVVPTTDFTPALGGYQEIFGACNCPQFNGTNLEFMTQAGINGNKKFWQDLVQGLIAQKAPVDAILAYALRNEIYFQSDLTPLSLASGMVTTANGKTYDMADPAAKQQMMDDNLANWTTQMRTAILQLDPTALVTVGFFQPQQPNPTRIGDPRVIQPYPAVANSTIDFVDLHAYPVIAGLTLQQYVQNFGMTGFVRQPVVMGEFGAAMSAYSSSDAAALALQSWQVNSCPFGFQGWLLWTWDTSEQFDFPHWFALSGNGAVNQSLAPANRSDPCK